MITIRRFRLSHRRLSESLSTFLRILDKGAFVVGYTIVCELVGVSEYTVAFQSLLRIYLHWHFLSFIL